MDKLNEIIKSLRKESLRDAARRIGISHNYLRNIEKGIDPRTKAPINPSPDTLKKISNAYNYPYELLLKAAGYIEPKTDGLTDKDEKDIAKRMEKMKKDLMEGNAGGEGLSFKGEPMSKEAMESLLESLEILERQTTLINKKFIPKKHRDNQ